MSFWRVLAKHRSSVIHQSAHINKHIRCHVSTENNYEAEFSPIMNYLPYCYKFCRILFCFLIVVGKKNFIAFKEKFRGKHFLHSINGLKLPCASETTARLFLQ